MEGLSASNQAHMDVAALPIDILRIVFSEENSFELNNRLTLRLVSKRSSFIISAKKKKKNRAKKA